MSLPPFNFIFEMVNSLRTSFSQKRIPIRPLSQPNLYLRFRQKFTYIHLLRKEIMHLYLINSNTTQIILSLPHLLRIISHILTSLIIISWVFTSGGETWFLYWIGILLLLSLIEIAVIALSVGVNFETGLKFIQFELEIQIIKINIMFTPNIRNFNYIEYQSPLVQLLTQKSWSMFRLTINRHPNNSIIKFINLAFLRLLIIRYSIRYRNILSNRKLLLNLNQLMLPNHQHIAQIANPTRSRSLMRHLNILQINVPLLQMLHQFP